MDASHDRDIELQRASGELIEEFRTKLPPLLWKHPNSGKRVVHRWARAAKVDKLILLLDPFQEWPQLLDPHLNWILTRLTDAFLSYLLGHGHSYGSVTKIKEPGMVYPLARAICKIIYTLCKVRGPKVISRFFSNEPKYLEPMLSMFIEWDTIVSTDINRSTRTGQGLPLNWEERYVMLLWLSHLLLAPFDLTSISSENTPIPYRNLSPFSELSSKAPKLALTILSISLKYLVLPGKEREGAILLLSRLALRKDMQQLGMLKSLIEWALRHLKPGLETTPPSTFTCIGLLSFIAKLATLSQVEDIAPFISSHEVSTILEDTIDYLLLAVGDKDTPVRFAASKALSMIALKLEPDLGADILDAVISALDEDVLYEEESGKLISKEKARSMVDKLVVRSFKSVDAQKWHGLMLTLGHLLFRRSPPLDRLSQLFECLVSGLTFEQRSSTGASIGVTVRDASCFGIWSLARKYSTRELESVEISPIENRNKYLLRSLAIELVSSACLDPSGNIRRGSSAALQELIGRHPDSISQGISIVQVVDYHSVARRESAMTEVAMAATKLDNVYWSPLIGGLLRWRGIGAPDPKSRRAAALAIGELSLQMAYAGIEDISEDPSPVIELSRQIHQLWGIFSSPMGPSVESLTLQEYRPDLTAEACSRLISSLARAYAVFGSDASRFGLQLDNGCLEKAVTILLLCVQRSEDETVAASSQAAVDMFAISSVERKSAIIQEWLKEVQSNRKKTTGRGQIAALGAVYRHSPSDEERKLILDELVRCSGPEEAVIVKRVSAVRFILTGVLPYLDNTDELESHIDVLLNDYTTDNRGDVGSLIRTEAINGVHMILVSRLRNPIGHSKVHNLIKHIIRLAAEKLDKVRFKAWKCFQVYWESDTSLPPLETRFYHFSEVSTAAYFTQLITLVQVEWPRLPLIKGLVTSLTAGADSLIISSRTAVVEFINSQNDNTRYCMQRDIFMSLLIVLEENITDDRYAIPTVESLAFFIENCFNPGILELDPDSIRKLFRLVQKFHFKSSNIPRIEAGLKAYYCLFNYELLRKNIVLKMTKMLLHPYPKIRALTSEYLFIQTGNKSLKTENWMQPPKQLKATVDNIVQAILS
ncbi:beta-tubulin cofactor d [Trichophyton equinum CBS 127.97]|uniref:Beta-tubulin cofactor d n=1 Tax=Trichophyton equinum (strain ATCC MYA-4606 / CBS 127.97) TaxID=559882 RepID=F2PUQ4_TRIEC|nr:beta-tubulin cofactor d [Trichophyton equinum CBS 127.97]